MEQERESHRGLEWLPAEQKARELFQDKLPASRHAGLIHFQMAWAQKQLSTHLKLPAEGEDWSERELAQMIPAMIAAMETRDETFFRDLYRYAKALFRPGYRTNEERVLQAAFALREEYCENPTRAEVKNAVAQMGVTIEDKDWSGYFKRCRLEFLEKGSPGRKPSASKGGRKRRNA